MPAARPSPSGSTRSIPKVGGSRGNAGKGRKKGSVNKTTATVKAALSLAFEGVGGVPKLQEWARENRTEFYKLWAKLLPQEVEMSGKDGGPVLLQVWQIGDRTVTF